MHLEINRKHCTKKKERRKIKLIFIHYMHRIINNSTTQLQYSCFKVIKKKKTTLITLSIQKKNYLLILPGKLLIKRTLTQFL